MYIYIYIYIYWVISRFGLVFFFAEQNRYLYSQAARSNYRRYLHVLKYLLFIIRVLKQKELCRQIGLHIFVKLSQLDVRTPTCLHHSFSIIVINT